MKLKKVLITLFSAALVFNFISCASKDAPAKDTPSAPETVVEDTTPEDTVEDAPVVDEEDEAAKEAARLAALEQKRQAAIEAFTNARIARSLIEEHDWQDYDYSDYESGCNKLEKIEAVYEDGGELDESLFETALGAYEDLKKVLDAAYRKLAKEERSLAVKAKNDADSVKAGVSRKEQYQKAVEIFKQGDSHFATRNPQKAYESYKESKEMLSAIYSDVSEKRAAAQAALEAAKKAVAESASYAEQADQLAPITEEIDGIEDEDAVLLEEDEYEDPFDAIVEIEESLEGEEDDDAEEAE